MASVAPHPDSPNWLAYYSAWDDKQEQMIRKCSSTGIPATPENKERALKVAYEFEELGAKDRKRQISEREMRTLIHTILTAMGYQTEDGRFADTWEQWRRIWLDRRQEMKPATRSLNLTSLRHFDQFGKQPLEKLGKRQWNRYLKWVDEQGWSTNTRRTRTGTVKNCLEDGGVKLD